MEVMHKSIMSLLWCCPHSVFGTPNRRLAAVRSRSKAGLGLAAREALKQPTWCLLHPDGWKVLAARASRARPEVLLFTRKRLEQKAVVAAAAASRPGHRAASRSIKDPHRGPGSGRSSTPQAGGPASDGVPRGGRSPGLTASSQ